MSNRCEQIAGFRDILVHDDHEADIEVVWKIVEKDSQPLKQAAEAILAQLARAQAADDSNWNQ